MSSTQAALSLNNSGLYTLSLSMREDGVRIDKMLLITDTNYIPTGNGSAESPYQIITDTTPAELNSHTVQYSYDDLYRLTGAVYTGDIAAAYSYIYDNVGSMTAYTETINGETSHNGRTFNAANQLISSSDAQQSTTYSYDDNGNLVFINRDDGNELEVTGYIYNQRNLLTSVNKTIGTGTTQPVADYIYDGSGDRIQQRIYTPSAPATIITYTNDIQGLTQVLAANDGTAITYNVYGLDLISQQAGDDDARLLLADGLGSVRQEMVGNTIKTTATYNPYGSLLAQSGNSGTVYGFTGEQEDGAGLLYLRARYYNSGLQVFMGKDAWSGDMRRPSTLNGHTYVANNPINMVDPTGNSPDCPVGSWDCETVDNISNLTNHFLDSANRHNKIPGMDNNGFAALIASTIASERRVGRIDESDPIRNRKFQFLENLAVDFGCIVSGHYLNVAREEKNYSQVWRYLTNQDIPAYPTVGIGNVYLSTAGNIWEGRAVREWQGLNDPESMIKSVIKIKKRKGNRWN